MQKVLRLINLLLKPVLRISGSGSRRIQSFWVTWIRILFPQKSPCNSNFLVVYNFLKYFFINYYLFCSTSKWPPTLIKTIFFIKLQIKESNISMLKTGSNAILLQKKTEECYENCPLVLMCFLIIYVYFKLYKSKISNLCQNYSLQSIKVSVHSKSLFAHWVALDG